MSLEQLIELITSDKYEEDLPDGIWEVDGKYYFECLSCGGTTEWPSDLSEYEHNHWSNVCSGSPRCIP